MTADGLTHVFGIIRTTPNVEDLPSNFQAVLEWGRISYVYEVPRPYTEISLIASTAWRLPFSITLLHLIPAMRAYKV